MTSNSARLRLLPRRRHVAGAVAFGVLTAGMLTACGSAGNDGPGGSVTVSPSTSASGSGSGSTVTELGGPVGYFRAGGIAGFMDQLMVSTDGVAVLQRHGNEIVRCKVKPAPLAKLAQLHAATVKSVPSVTTGPRAMPPAHADMMTVGVIVGGTRVPSNQLASYTIDWSALFETMSSLFEDAVALSPGATSSPNTSASMCDPI